MKITLKTPDYQARTAQVRALGAKIAEARQAATIVIAQDMQKTMRQPGESPTHPIQWDSPKQRSAFFATNGFGGGIPHKRTGEYEKSFKIEAIGSGVKFYSDSPALPFVGGNAFGLVRSGIHTGRWVLLQTAVQDGLSRMKQAHIDATKKAIMESYV